MYQLTIYPPNADIQGQLIELYNANLKFWVWKYNDKIHLMANGKIDDGTEITKEDYEAFIEDYKKDAIFNRRTFKRQVLHNNQHS